MWLRLVASHWIVKTEASLGQTLRTVGLTNRPHYFPRGREKMADVSPLEDYH